MFIFCKKIVRIYHLKSVQLNYILDYIFVRYVNRAHVIMKISKYLGYICTNKKKLLSFPTTFLLAIGTLISGEGGDYQIPESKSIFNLLFSAIFNYFQLVPLFMCSLLPTRMVLCYLIIKFVIIVQHFYTDMLPLPLIRVSDYVMFFNVNICDAYFYQFHFCLQKYRVFPADDAGFLSFVVLTDSCLLTKSHSRKEIC